MEAPYTFEQLRAASARQLLKPLIRHLSDNCHHSEIVPALLYVDPHPGGSYVDDVGYSNGTFHRCNKTIMASTKVVLWPVNW